MNVLMLANHEENEWEFRGEIYHVQPGQFVTSLENLKGYCASDLTIQNIRTALLKLEKHGFLTNQSTKKNRLISVVNWGIYQGGGEDANKDTNRQPTNSQQSDEKKLTTNKNYKELKELKDLKDMSDSDECDVSFEQWYDLYPKQGSVRKKAVESWRSLWKNKKIDLEKVKIGTLAYLKHQKHHQYKTCAAQVFLNQQRWNDDWEIENDPYQSSAEKKPEPDYSKPLEYVEKPSISERMKKFERVREGQDAI